MNVLVMYGGKSCEHDISIITAKQAVKNLPAYVNAVEVYVTKEGKWLIADGLKNPQDFSDAKRLARLPQAALLAGHKELFHKVKNKLKPCFCPDAALLCFHGVNGEDGSVQGLLQLCGIPYTSSGVTASGVAMDKIVCKQFFKGLGIPVVKGEAFTRTQFANSPETVLKAAEKALKFPVIVKPSNLGSSIGISVCNNAEELSAALETAFHFDLRVLVEQALTDCTEINCSALCAGEEVLCSAKERPVSWQQFLTFEEKYINNAKDSMSSAREFPYETPHNDQIEKIVKKVCTALNCKGVLRLDFLLDNKTDKIFLNEINSIPGSLSFYLWKDSYKFSQLIDMLLKNAVRQANEENGLQYLFRSDVLDGVPTKTRKS